MNDVSPGKLTIIIGAIVTFLFSFLPWATVSGYGSGISANAWGSGMFPMATWAPVLALVVGFIAAAQAFEFVELPAKIWEFTLDQIIFILSAFSLVITLSYLVVDKGGASNGFGLFLSFLGTVAMIAGFFLDRAGVGVHPNSQAPSDPPPPVSETASDAPTGALSGDLDADAGPARPQPPAQGPPPDAEPGSF